MIQPRHIFCLMCCGFGLFVSQAVSAQTLPVTIGKWHITTTISSPSLPQPRFSTQTRCVDEPEVDPFEGFTRDEGCELRDVKKEGGKLTARLSCGSAEGVTPMSGTLEYTVTETTMNSRMRFESKDFSQTIRAVGRYLGECDEEPEPAAEAQQGDEVQQGDAPEPAAEAQQGDGPQQADAAQQAAEAQPADAAQQGDGPEQGDEAQQAAE